MEKLYPTQWTDRRIIVMRQSNGIRRQLTPEEIASLDGRHSISEEEDWREGLKELSSPSNGHDDE